MPFFSHGSYLVSFGVSYGYQMCFSSIYFSFRRLQLFLDQKASKSVVRSSERVHLPSQRYPDGEFAPPAMQFHSWGLCHFQQFLSKTNRNRKIVVQIPKILSVKCVRHALVGCTWERYSRPGPKLPSLEDGFSSRYLWHGKRSTQSREARQRNMQMPVQNAFRNHLQRLCVVLLPILLWFLSLALARAQSWDIFFIQEANHGFLLCFVSPDRPTSTE